MKNALEIGALLIVGIFAFAIWQKAIAQSASFTPIGAQANRTNAWTSLAYNGGTMAEGDLQNLFNQYLGG